MIIRTNFDIIDKTSGTVLLASRGRDCFGQYTNSMDFMRGYKNHIVDYYLPEQFVKFYDYKVIPYKDYIDNLVLNEEDTNTYIELLNKWINGINIVRLEDYKYTIDIVRKLYGEQYTWDSDNLPEEITVRKLRFDLSTSANIKEVKIRLFFVRYLINNFGGAVLQRMFKYMKQYPDLNPWDAFIASESITSLVESRMGYNIFSVYIHKYFTLEEFFEKVILKDPGQFMYASTFLLSDLVPYKSTSGEENYGKISKVKKDFINKFPDVNKIDILEYLEYWKNYNW